MIFVIIIQIYKIKLLSKIVKKLPIILAITIGILFLSIIAFMQTQSIEQAQSIEQVQSIEQPQSISVFDLNYCPNQNKIVGEMWFIRDELTTIPVRATINYEINDLDDLIEEGEIKITPENFEIWNVFGNEVYLYYFEIPVQSNVTDKNLIFTVMLDGGGNLVYEDTIKRLTSLDNCRFS